MSKFSVLIVLAFLVALCAADIATFSYFNVSTTNTNFASRFSTAGDISVAGIVNAASYSSIAIQRGNGSATIDGVHGAAFQLIGFSPVASLAYFDVNANYQPGSNNQQFAFDASAAASYIGYLFAGVEEIDGTSGKIVRYNFFKNYVWHITNQSAGGSPVPFVTFEGKNSNSTDTLVVDLTFIIPSALINLQVSNSGLNTLVSPKGLEILVGINAASYNYKSTNNFLRLVTLAVTGTASAKGSVTSGINGAKTLLQSGSGSSQVNLRFIPTVLVGSNLASAAVTVTVTSSSNFTQIDVGALMNQVNAKYGNSASLNVITVDFPAGATLLVYDPTMTAGDDPAVTSGSSSIIVSLFLLGLLICLFF
jgi:hypothetical protein